MFVTAHVVLRTAAMFLASALNRGSHPPGNIKKWLLIPGEILLFKAPANNMAPMTNTADESLYAFLTEHFSLSSFYSLARLTIWSRSIYVLIRGAGSNFEPAGTAT